jgi:hypothetical protein
MSEFKWGNMLRFNTDDRDVSSAQLCIMQGNNGDWYVSVADGPDHYPTTAVRICTSGGASASHPGLGLSISRAYEAILCAQEGRTPQFLDDERDRISRQLAEMGGSGGA